MKTTLAIISVVGLALVLHGCGGGGGGSTTVTTTTPSVPGGNTDTTTGAVPGTTGTTIVPPAQTTSTPLCTANQPPLPARTKPMSSQEAADYLNKLYKAFNETDDKSQIGVTLSMAASTSGFFENIFCSSFCNPIRKGHTSCYDGQADCRMSASVLNYRWMIDNKTKAIASFGQRRVGYVFNQTMVQSKWTKCSYIWDGATYRLYNRGCGDGAPSTTCDKDANSAFNNQCGITSGGGSDKHTCTPEDDEVKRAICVGAGGTRKVPTNHADADNPECVFPGPAFGYHGQSDYKYGEDYTRYMAKMRLKYNKGEDKEGNNTMKNNEVVLDELLLMEDIRENPIYAIPAIVYTESQNVEGINRKYAMDIRKDLCTAWGCEENGGGLIPLVKIDDTRYWPDGPFKADTGSDGLQIV